jgi:hypothetical protein
MDFYRRNRCDLWKQGVGWFKGCRGAVFGTKETASNLVIRGESEGEMAGVAGET